VTGLNPSGARASHNGDPEELKLLIDSLCLAARDASRRYRIDDYREDLVQDAFQIIWQEGSRPDDEEVARRVGGLAAKEARRRRRERSGRRHHVEAMRAYVERRPAALDPVRLVPPQDTASKVGVPCLCAGFARLADGTGHEDSMAQHALAAAVFIARQPGVLQLAQFKAFTLAYVYTLPIGEIAASLRTTPRGATEQLKRIVRRLESAMLESTRHDLGRAAIKLLKSRKPEPAEKKTQKTPSAVRTRVCAQVLDALEAVFVQTRANRMPR